ncbi:hypothetical protein N7452_004821 [Penicillium brevicompactum]|uniref:Zn(2)-C6 fungal-type domain-containing protein n=1 Tax=Penicillium brevicompactum TaxID=5074 RepID=A0A9W9QNA4_PENBR|nr:hypothetical protein N7452_004821 [Penicillium brevicompactum]
MDSLNRIISPDPEPSNKRPNNDTAENPKPKKHRRGRHEPEPDWSAQMREKVSKSSNRVGHACDRCKLKKMRCTPDVNGCGCCIVLNLPCKVTDRVTGETFVRGAAGKMYQEIYKLQQESIDQKMQIAIWQHKCALLEQMVENLQERTNTPVSDDFGTFEVGYI